LLTAEIETPINAVFALGAVRATGLYGFFYRHYLDTDKSHAFEYETAAKTKPVIGSAKGRRSKRHERDTHSR
jgi:hypothetical protein